MIEDELSQSCHESSEDDELCVVAVDYYAEQAVNGSASPGHLVHLRSTPVSMCSAKLRACRIIFIIASVHSHFSTFTRAAKLMCRDNACQFVWWLGISANCGGATKL